MDTENQFNIASTPKALEEYLLDADADFISMVHAKQFNLIDVVFINGKRAPDPWSPASKQVDRIFVDRLL